MKHRGKRIKLLREKLGHDLKTMAEKVGLNSSWYWDLEGFDNEVTDTLSIKEVEKLSKFFNVSPRYLLAEDETSINSVNLITPHDLAGRIKEHLEINQIEIEKFEDEIGWEVQWLLNDPNEIYDRPAMFLIAICKPLKIAWLEVVPN